MNTLAEVIVIVLLPCAALGTLLWRLLAHRRGTPSRVRAVIEHAAFATAFSAVLTGTIFALYYLIQPNAALSFLGADAIWQFAYGFVIYALVAAAARAARMRGMLKERELAATVAELQALRARLNPHFLFNTLHSLSQLAREDPTATETALAKFGELLRYVLSAGDANAEVSLEAELDFVRNYLALERLRLGERLNLIEEIDSDALEVAVPPLLLQPLVENAVRHGLAPRRDGGTIRLRLGIADETVEIEVADDGNGCEPDSWQRSGGLGLEAVQRQIEARFGARGGFAVMTLPGEGFRVRLTLPATLPLVRAEAKFA